MYVGVWNRTRFWYKFSISVKTGWKRKVISNLVLNPVLNLGPGSESSSESGSVWHLIVKLGFPRQRDKHRPNVLN